MATSSVSFQACSWIVTSAEPLRAYPPRLTDRLRLSDAGMKALLGDWQIAAGGPKRGCRGR